MNYSQHTEVVSRLLKFVQSCSLPNGAYRLTGNADVSPFSICFAIFCYSLTRQLHDLEHPKQIASTLVRLVRDERRKWGAQRPTHKSYRQLLTFVLSSLQALKAIEDHPLEDLIIEQIDCEPLAELTEHGCLDGRAGSGNQAMFLAIFLLHARERLNIDTRAALDEWVELHLSHMNRFGFWGDDRWMTHLQFQNGYHQHEIFEYLGVENPCLQQTLTALRSLADREGHFAPYPGGGGCYDYDAVFMLTPHGRIPDATTRRVLEQTASTLLAEQNPDGGFCESLQVRPRSTAQLAGFVSHAWAARGNPGALRERLRYGLTLQRPKHNRIHTHWSQYSRGWNESDLWDSWFRMLALARIDVAMHPEHAGHWGFIDYPGIGYHPSLRAAKVER